MYMYFQGLLLSEAYTAVSCDVHKNDYKINDRNSLDGIRVVIAN